MTDSPATGPLITADAAHEPVTAPPGLPGPVHRFGPLIALAAFGLVIDRLIRFLNQIPNDPDAFNRWDAPLTAAIAILGAILLAGPIISSRWAPLARAHRFAGACIGAGIIFWWLPIPFGVARFVTWVLLYACAGVYLAINLRCALRPRSGPHAFPASVPWWAAGAAVAAILASLLSDKHNSLAFSTAID